MKQKNFLIVVFSFLFVLLFAFVILFMVHVKKTDAIVLKKKLSCQFGDVVYVSDFVSDLDGEVIDDYLVDTSSIGKKRVEIQFKNSYGFVEKKRFYINVKDEVAPTILVDNPYDVYVGSVSNLLDSIFCADDYDDGIGCVISGSYDLNLVGEYPLVISAKDKSGNEIKKDFVLRVGKKEDTVVVNEEVDFRMVYDKYKNNDTEIGIDFLRIDGDIDYGKLVENGVSFVMFKIGGQSDIGGNILEDTSFDKNVKEALEHGLKVGVYFSSMASNESEARKQARWVVQAIRNYNIELPVMLDWNNWDNFSMFRIGFRSLNNIGMAFIQEVNRYGYDAGLYSSSFDNVWYKDKYKYQWIKGNFDNFMGQVDGGSKVDGVNGEFHIDILKKNIE